MFYSKKLLLKFLPQLKNISNEQLITACGSIGTEIDKIIVHPKLNGLVIGKLISFEKHPNADKLNVCKVQIADDQYKTIVCGAKNLKINKNVIVALDGAELYVGTIKNKEIRGVLSEGMLCGYSELTPYNSLFVSKEDSEGILLFDDGIIGDTNIDKFLGLDDEIYEISIPFANRNDLNGALAICQELSGYFGWKFKYPKLNPLKINKNNTENLNIDIIYDDRICNAYSLTKINLISTQPSPWTMKKLLMNNGIKPINDVLDRLNYITLLTNIPSAIYDANHVNDILVTNANNNEKFIGFDDVERTLDNNDIVIKCNDKILCLAGILGAKEYGVNNSSTNIFVEFGNFLYTSIRDSSIKHNIRTDAARRFSKPTTIFSTLLATQMLKDVFDSKQITWTKIKTNANKPNMIKPDYDLISTVIGEKYTPKQIKAKLESFGFGFKLNKIIEPAWRNDVFASYDLAEELIKSFKVNEIEEVSIDYSNMKTNNKYTENFFIENIKRILNENYFYECKTYNTSTEKDKDLFNLFNVKSHKIVSSHNANRAYLRTNTIHSLLKVYKFNTENKNKLLPVFEIQKIYDISNEKGEINLTLLSPEKIILDQINNSSICYNVLGLKGILEELNNLFNSKLTYKNINKTEWFAQNEQLEIYYNDQLIGFIGLINSNESKKYDLDEKIYCLTINLGLLINNFNHEDTKFKQFSLLPNIWKDLTINILTNNNVGDKINDIVCNYPFITKYEFINKFENESKKTYTVRFYFENNGKNASQIDEEFKKIVSLFNN